MNTCIAYATMSYLGQALDAEEFVLFWGYFLYETWYLASKCWFLPQWYLDFTRWLEFLLKVFLGFQDFYKDTWVPFYFPRPISFPYWCFIFTMDVYFREGFIFFLPHVSFSPWMFIFQRDVSFPMDVFFLFPSTRFVSLWMFLFPSACFFFTMDVYILSQVFLFIRTHCFYH